MNGHVSLPCGNQESGILTPDVFSRLRFGLGHKRMIARTMPSAGTRSGTLFAQKASYLP